MKNHFKTILYIIPLFVCLTFGFPCFASDTGFAFGSDVLTGSNGSANINSLLGDTYSFESLFSPGFVIGVSNAYDELNNQLYDRFGWDLDDAGQKIIDIASGGGDELGLTLNILAQTVNSPATDILSGGYQLFQFVRSGGAKSLVLGLSDQANTTLDKIKGTLLNQVTSADISNIVSGIDDLVDNEDIVDLSVSNSVAYGKDFQIVYILSGNTCVLNLHFTHNIFLFTDSYLVNGNYRLYACCLDSDIGNIALNNSSYVYNGNAYPITNFSISNGGSFSISGVRYYRGFFNFDTTQSFGSFGYSRVILGGSYLALEEFISSLKDTLSVNYKSGLNYNTIMQLLNSLEGKWVSTSDMATIRDLLDGGVITQADTTGELVYEFDDTIVDSLADIIDDLLEKSQAIEGELEDVISDSGTADPDDPDDPTGVDTGISVPPDYPTSTFDTLNDVISSPLEFFSIFEPIFLIFGSNALMIFGMWLFVPCVLIIAFIIWALK